MPAPYKQVSTPEIAKRAVATVRVWESGVRDHLECPICGAEGLGIIDKSARPHMAWYALKCNACGLDEAIAIPESAHSSERD
jgi:transcription elongation factor Elf1